MTSDLPGASADSEPGVTHSPSIYFRQRASPYGFQLKLARTGIQVCRLCQQRKGKAPPMCSRRKQSQVPMGQAPFSAVIFYRPLSGPGGRNKPLPGGSEPGHSRGHWEPSRSINEHTDAKGNHLLRLAQAPEAHQQKEGKFHEGLVSPVLQECPPPLREMASCSRLSAQPPPLLVQSCFLHPPDLERVPLKAPY